MIPERVDFESREKNTGRDKIVHGVRARCERQLR